MKVFLRLAFKSLSFRKSTFFLSVFSIVLSVSLLLGVERLRHASRQSFTSTVSGVDLIVGARSGSLPLMLYTVFQIGNPTNNLTWDTYKEITNSDEVKWSIPISLGDSHKSYRVIATNNLFFQHYRFGEKRSLEFLEGKAFDGLFDVVIGNQVYQKEGYRLGQEIVLSHGVGTEGIQEHDNLPFKIKGVLKASGTPIDRSVIISLEAMEAIHYDWQSGYAPSMEEASTAKDFIDRDLKPSTLTAFFLNLESMLGVFDFQDRIRNYKKEPLTAVMPGVALQDLWKIMSGVEKILFLLSLAVFFVALISVYLALQMAAKERIREIAILRSLGASPLFVFGLLFFDACLQAVLGIIIGITILFSILFFNADTLANNFALYKGLFELSSRDLFYLLFIFLGVVLSAFIPVWHAFTKSINHGLVVKN